MSESTRLKVTVKRAINMRAAELQPLADVRREIEAADPPAVSLHQSGLRTVERHGLGRCRRILITGEQEIRNSIHQEQEITYS